MVGFKDKNLKPRLYKSVELRKLATDFLIDFYESAIEWVDTRK